MKRRRRPPRYFNDRATQCRRIALGAGTLSALILLYTVGTAAGFLHP